MKFGTENIIKCDLVDSPSNLDHTKVFRTTPTGYYIYVIILIKSKYLVVMVFFQDCNHNKYIGKCILRHIKI
jgi:hypothetical protein